MASYIEERTCLSPSPRDSSPILVLLEIRFFSATITRNSELLLREAHFHSSRLAFAPACALLCRKLSRIRWIFAVRSAARSAALWRVYLLRNPLPNRDLPECLRKEAAVVSAATLPVRRLAKKYQLNPIAATYRRCKTYLHLVPIL